MSNNKCINYIYRIDHMRCYYAEFEISIVKYKFNNLHLNYLLVNFISNA